MHALEFQGEQAGWSELRASDRPTIPVPAPRESGVRLKVARVAYAAATIDVVVCDLSRDPRSEDHAPAGADEAVAAVASDATKADEPAPATQRSGFFPARARPRFGAFAVIVGGSAYRGAAQNERPPSTSIVRALK